MISIRRTPEGTAFDKTKAKKKKKKSDDNKEGDCDKKDNPFKDVECFDCKKKSHSTKNCPDKKDKDNNSTSSKASLKSLEKQFKLVQKSFAQLHAATNDTEDDKQSHFQFLNLNKTLDKLSFKQSRGRKLKDIDLQSKILLDSCSTVNLFCNNKFIHNIQQSSKPFKLSSNGGNMTINHIAIIGMQETWYSAHAVTNILLLKFVGAFCRVT